MVRKNGTVWVLVLAALMAFGCEERAYEERTEEGEAKPGEMIGEERGATAEATGTTGQPSQLDQAAQQGQAEVLGILMTANRAEIEAASHVEENASSDEVKELAKKIREHHERALSQESDLAEELSIQAAMDGRQVQELQRNHDSQMRDLREASGAELDRQYVTTQIQVHEQTLNDIDRQLMPRASGELTSHLREMREHVEEHLSELRELQGQLEPAQGRRTARQGQRQTNR